MQSHPNYSNSAIWVFIGMLSVGTLALTNNVASAQSLDDLFSRPDESQLDSHDGQNEAAPSMRMPQRPLRTQPATASESGQTFADSPIVRRTGMNEWDAPATTRSPSDLKLVDESGSQMRSQQPTVMQLRQARALYESRQRMARLEAARWSGNPTLRPSWNPDPSSTSRFPNRRIVYVPAYYRTR